MPAGPPPSQGCAIVGAVDALGDTWSLLVLRELFYGLRRFNDMQADLGISRSVLTARLKRLVDLGIVRTVPYQDPGDRTRHEYRLTRKGVGLLPVVIGLLTWGGEHLDGEYRSATIHDRSSGEQVFVELRTASGRRVEPNEIEPRQRPEHDPHGGA